MVRKYFMLVLVLCTAPYLQATETMQFATVLSKPVGSFWSVDTSTCAYPNVNGGAPDSITGKPNFSEQVVVNINPAHKTGGSVVLQGPLNIDTLLLEDHAVLTGNTLWMVDKVFLYPEADLQVGRIFINTLLLPRIGEDGESAYADYKIHADTLKILWRSMSANTISFQCPENNPSCTIQMSARTEEDPQAEPFQMIINNQSPQHARFTNLPLSFKDVPGSNEGYQFLQETEN